MILRKLFVGIDVSKDKLDVSFLDAEESQVRPTTTYDNRPRGWQELLDTLESSSTKYGTILCGMESTARFHEGLAHVLREQERVRLEVHILNPLAVKRLGQAMLRNAKTDRADGRLIAQYLIRMKPEPVLAPSPKQEALKEVTRRRRRLVEDRSQETNRLHASLHKHYTGYQDILGRRLTISLLSVLADIQSPRAILARSLEDLAQISTGHRHVVGQKIAKRIHEVARQAREQELPRSTEIMIQLSARRILELRTHIGALDECIAEMVKGMPFGSLLQSIPGIGPVTAATILAEVGDIGRFPTKEKLVGYCGLYPIVWESGTVKRKYRMTRQGNRWLKTALLVVSGAVRQYNPPLAAFYTRLRNAGKSVKAAGGALAAKLAHLVWAMMTNNQPWSLEKAERGRRKAEAMLAVTSG